MASSARIDELRKKFDENPRRYFAPLANEYRKAGDLEQAIFICQEYLPQQPGHMSGHIVYGQALFELSRFDESSVVFETALSLDPENLIALRHLGDIARQAGDLRGARVWYQRVLEADPRNEEIAQMMLTILATPHGGQPVVPSGATPLSTAAVMSPDSGGDGNAGDKSGDRTDLAVGPELNALPERQAQPEPAPEPVMRRSREALPDHELLDLNDFSVGDTPLASLAGTPVEPPAPARTPDSVVEKSAPVPADDSVFIFGENNVSFEADPFAIAATPSSDASESRVPSTEDFATDIVLGLPDDGGSPSLADPHDAAVLDGLESFSDPSIGFSAEPSATLEVGSFFEAPPVAPMAFDAFSSQEPEWHSVADADPDVVAKTPAPEASPAEVRHDDLEVTAEFPAPFGVPAAEEPAPAPAAAEETPPAEAFVTETMAELYLQQGHVEKALDIYQRLVEQRPGDEQLYERWRAVEEGIRSEAAVGRPESAIEGPTIREFLSDLLRAQVAFPAEQSGVTSEVYPTPSFDESTFGESSFHDEPAVATGLNTVDLESFGSDFELPVGEIHESAEDMSDLGPESPIPEPMGGELSVVDASVAEAQVPDMPVAELEMPRVAVEPVVGEDVAGQTEPDEPFVPMAAVRLTPASAGTVSGSIDALFTGADASSSDANAATTLAQAFASDGPEAPPLQGMPAHRAIDELSLDHVFKTNPAPRPETEEEGFSFDQFFADDMDDAAPKSSTEAPSSAEQGTDDIAQFNNWLNGLKKT